MSIHKIGHKYLFVCDLRYLVWIYLNISYLKVPVLPVPIHYLGSDKSVQEKIGCRFTFCSNYVKVDTYNNQGWALTS